MWLRVTVSIAELAGVHAHGLANLRAVAGVIAASARRDHSCTAWPGDDHITTTTGLSNSTVRRWRRWLRTHGLLVTTETGTTPHYRPGILRHNNHRNRRNVYLLTLPTHLNDPGPDNPEADPAPSPTSTDVYAKHFVEQSDRPRQLPEGEEPRGKKPQRARETPPQQKTDKWGETQRWGLWKTPRSRAEMLAACQRLRAENATLARISTRWLRATVREAFRAGATPADLLWALDHRPDGVLWPHTERIRHIPGWIRHRLTTWRTPDGTFHPWPSQHAADARTHLRATQTQQRAARQQQAARVADPERVREIARERRAVLLREQAQRRTREARGTGPVGPGRSGAYLPARFTSGRM